MQRTTSNGFELRLISGGVKDEHSTFKSLARHPATDMSLEGIWKEMRIRIISDLVDSVSAEIETAFKSGILSLREGIPSLSDERLLRGNHDYIRLKRTDPAAASRAMGLGVGTIDDFNKTISETFKDAIKGNFEEFMDGLAAINNILNRSMPSAHANKIADMHMSILTREIMALKETVLGQITVSEDAIGLKIAGNTLFSGSKKISGYIERETEQLRDHGTSLVRLKAGARQVDLS